MAYTKSGILPVGSDYKLGNYTISLSTHDVPNANVIYTYSEISDSSGKIDGKGVNLPIKPAVRGWLIEATETEVSVYARCFDLPNHISIIHPADKTHYEQGENIDLTGLVVQAYNADGTIWSTQDYPDGIIPLDELTYELDSIPDYSMSSATVDGVTYSLFSGSFAASRSINYDWTFTNGTGSNWIRYHDTVLFNSEFSLQTSGNCFFAFTDAYCGGVWIFGRENSSYSLTISKNGRTKTTEARYSWHNRDINEYELTLTGGQLTPDPSYFCEGFPINLYRGKAGNVEIDRYDTYTLPSKQLELGPQYFDTWSISYEGETSSNWNFGTGFIPWNGTTANRIAKKILFEAALSDKYNVVLSWANSGESEPLTTQYEVEITQGD